MHCKTSFNSAKEMTGCICNPVISFINKNCDNYPQREVPQLVQMRQPS